ncbi:hydantoinase/oxoprolinase family protein [Chloroflexota bacterium]
MARERDVSIIGSDAGGTMTDVFVVDREGYFVIGKAGTTPDDESTGFWNSLVDSFEYWGGDWQNEAKELLPGVDACVYSGTAMLNVLLTRTGQKLGLICTRGQEDVLLHERAKHTYAGYSWSDRLHLVTHIHNEPLVPKKLIRGVTERVSVLGEPVVPLYEHEAREAVEYLLSRGVEGVVVWLLCSYINPTHEERIADIANEVMKEKGIEVPVYCSSQVCPIMREVSRLTSTLLHAFAADRGRRHLFAIENRLRENGYTHPLQVVLGSGGIANIRYPRLHEATFSGPIGGLLGAQYLGDSLGIPNLVCTDVGGTSFDVGLITDGEHTLLREVEMAHCIFNIPTVVLDSIGSGTGTYLTLNPETKRLQLGPESAGADPGPVCYDNGNEIPTAMDCCLILGILNPDYYLGGKMKLDKSLAYKAIKERCADPLNIDPYDFAAGVVDLLNLRMREHVSTVVSVRGLSLADYYLIGYGGAGPMFLAGYSEGLPLKGVFTVPFAAAFSAFGCTAIDYVHRYQKSILVVIPVDANENLKIFMGSTLNREWEVLENLALKEMKEEGVPEGEIKLEQIAYVRYFNQLEEVEVQSPSRRVTSGEDMDRLIRVFEEKYSSLYTLAARHAEAGYQIMEVGIRASAAKPKPVIREYALGGKEPPKEATKGEREVYALRQWRKATLYEMDRLRPGNEVHGLAIVEAPATTLFVPESRKIRVDEYGILWLEEDMR